MSFKLLEQLKLIISFLDRNEEKNLISPSVMPLKRNKQMKHMTRVPNWIREQVESGEMTVYRFEFDYQTTRLTHLREIIQMKLQDYLNKYHDLDAFGLDPHSIRIYHQGKTGYFWKEYTIKGYADVYFRKDYTKLIERFIRL